MASDFIRYLLGNKNVTREAKVQRKAAGDPEAHLKYESAEQDILPGTKVHDEHLGQ